MDYYIFLIKINYIPLILLLERLVAKNIVGLHNTNGGDLAFAKDGTLFMCTFLDCIDYNWIKLMYIKVQE
jgi:hypothetical protein